MALLSGGGSRQGAGAAEHDVAFEAMGSRLRLLIGEPQPGLPTAAGAAAWAQRFVAEFETRLSRFRAGSELRALNADERELVPASALLRDAVRAGLQAARRSEGLVDPTLLPEIEAAGYVGSRAGAAAEPLAAALAVAPPRRQARADPRARWRQIEVDEVARTIRRPPGTRFDTGGSGKGLAADLIAASLKGYSRFLVDCGGDIRIGGAGALLRPYEVLVADPLSGEPAYALRLGSGAVATSGLGMRLWRTENGGYAHHLLDPSSGEPAWTGLIAATALADTTREAETLAKTALLRGPDGGRAVLSERGGLLVHDSGRFEALGPISARPLPPRRAGGGRPS